MGFPLTSALPELQRAEADFRRAAAAIGIRYDYAAKGDGHMGEVRTESDTSRAMKYRDDDYAVYVAQLKRSHPGAVPMPKEEWRAIAPFGSSFHNYGAAFDVNPIVWPASMGTRDKVLARLGAIAPQFGLRWGGTFTHRKDPPHFELAVTLDDARRRWAAHGGTAGKPPAGAVAAVTDVAKQATQNVADVVTSAVDTVAAQADKLTGGLPPIASAVIAAVALGVLGALVVRRVLQT